MTTPTKVVVSLIDREREYSLLHISLSRVTKFSNLGIRDMEDLAKNRLCSKTQKYKK